MPRILALAGSARRDSLNKRLLAVAAELAREKGADVSIADPADFPMPIYDGDTEQAEGIPENAARLRELMMEHDAFLLACPEYNGSITPLLKNIIDWTSRPADGAPGLAAFQGKTCALLSASPGGWGGMRGLVHVRAILSGIGVLVIPQDVSVPRAHEAFNEDGMLADVRVQGFLDACVARLVETTSSLAAK